MNFLKKMLFLTISRVLKIDVKKTKKEFGELVEAIKDGSADKKFTREESERIINEAYDVIECIIPGFKVAINFIKKKDLKIKIKK